MTDETAGLFFASDRQHSPLEQPLPRLASGKPRPLLSNVAAPSLTLLVLVLPFCVTLVVFVLPSENVAPVQVPGVVPSTPKLLLVTAAAESPGQGSRLYALR